MGVYLATPKTAKDSEDGGSFPTSDTRFGLSAMQGWRQYMEDAHIADPEFMPADDEFSCTGLFGVFDGHGGPAVSSWVAVEFKQILRDELVKCREEFKLKKLKSKTESVNDEVASACEALQRAFLRVDVEISKDESRATLKLIHENNERLKKVEQEGTDSRPASLLDALLTGVAGRRPVIRTFEREGQRYYRLMAADATPDDDDDDEDDDMDGGGGAAATQGEHEEKVESPVPGGDKTTDSARDSGADDGSENNNNNHGDDDVTASSATEVTKQNKDHDGEDNGDDDDDGDDDDADAASHGAAAVGHNGAMLPYQPECCGSTAVVAMVIGGASPMLAIANAGDSRGVLCRDGTAIALSRDHKPLLRGESRRISRAGGKVMNGRVDGNLNLSRALGDLFYKADETLPPSEQKITAFPDVRVVPLNAKDSFVILACDGIWDCMTNQEAVDFVLTFLTDGAATDIKLSTICEKLCDRCISSNPLNSEGGVGCDNMTVCIVLLGDTIKSASACRSTPPAAAVTDVIFYGPEPPESDYEEDASAAANDTSLEAE